ncbi:HAD-IA family hydrolase [Actinoplanes sp. ATCC 53533]|uniref:HAD-IA family hydrolase n=1 Tax=Actinoplanes sp. ATCC 53533 TaxID=1288362 RepID=UPI001F2318B2|nr:HAD-IA family hydrolase [Actinoplanes sp. ATCC 53533]
MTPARGDRVQLVHQSWRGGTRRASSGRTLRHRGYLRRCSGRSGKPAPDVFLLAAQRLRAEPQQRLVYEDAESGVVAALEAGTTACNVRTGHLQHSKASPPITSASTTTAVSRSWSR